MFTTPQQEAAVDWWQNLLDPAQGEPCSGTSAGTGFCDPAQLTSAHLPVIRDERKDADMERQAFQSACRFVFPTSTINQRAPHCVDQRAAPEKQIRKEHQKAGLHPRAGSRQKCRQAVAGNEVENKRSQAPVHKAPINLVRNHYKRGKGRFVRNDPMGTFNAPEDFLAKRLLRSAGWATEHELKEWRTIGNRMKTPSNSLTLARQYNAKREKAEFEMLLVHNPELEL